MVQRLDRSKPYGTIHPPFDGMRYEQNNTLFDIEGYPQGYAGKREAASAASSSPKRPPSPVATTSTRITDPVEEDDNSGDEGEDSGEFENKDAIYSDDKGTVDMIAWSRGDSKYPFYRVKAAAKALMPDSDNTSNDSILAALVENGFIQKD